MSLVVFFLPIYHSVLLDTIMHSLGSPRNTEIQKPRAFFKASNLLWYSLLAFCWRVAVEAQQCNCWCWGETDWGERGCYWLCLSTLAQSHGSLQLIISTDYYLHRLLLAIQTYDAVDI
jgi:hypothetical protein